MNRTEQGHGARKAGDDFEKRIEPTFAQYLEADIASLDFFPVPMAPAGHRDKHGKPLYRPKGTAPCDVWGFECRSGRIIAAELKSTSDDPSLRIVLPGKKGSGLQWHQLCMLRNVAICGGIARLVWENAGQVGVIREKKIVNAWQRAYTALNQETGAGTAGGKKINSSLNAKSIKWLEFEEVEYAQLGGAGTPVLDWLKPSSFGDSLSPA